ncbi:MAG: KH domain-containing protein [Bifidobacteriaceae bacterium]|jgi:predicted RNA-binding protein YlqC (UPF0109 family)|nr:KH domain-containing protein [Bifidobacteriaceae bacterium]
MIERLLEHLVKGIAHYPQDISVATRQGDGSRSDTVNVYINAADAGRIIGHGGKGVKSLQTVINAAAHGRHAPYIKIIQK